MSGASLDAIGARPLTPGEADALRIIQEFVETRSASPTRMELMREMGLRSTSGAQRYVEALAEKGWIDRAPLRKHGIEVLHWLPEPVECGVELTERGCAYLAGAPS